MAAGSPADGCSIEDLELGDGAWISMINRGGALVSVRGDSVLQAGDELPLLTDPDSETDPARLLRPTTDTPRRTSTNGERAT
jgi:potassium/hydrogen antiporter